jgi:DNA polymerase III epsilon subunit-like protein
MNLLFTDVETGGLKAGKHSLLQVALVAVKDGVENGRIDFFISQDNYTVTPEALKINKLDLLQVKKEGVSPERACQLIIEFIAKYFGTEKPILVGHNVNFDKGFLSVLFEENGINIEKYISHRMIDTMSLLWGLYDVGKVPFEACNSKGAFEYFNIIVDKLHDALDDTLATVQLYYKILELLK